MDTGAVSRIASDKDLSSAHSITCGVADAPLHDDFSFIHRIADGILRIGVDCETCAVQVCAESISGDPFDGDIFV